MSILIKGMEMPKDEPVIIQIMPDGSVRKPYRDVFLKYESMKAMTVSEHGRLIDADAQDTQIEALIERHLHGYTKSTWDFVCELRDILKRNPTITPEEEGET